MLISWLQMAASLFQFVVPIGYQWISSMARYRSVAVEWDGDGEGGRESRDIRGSSVGSSHLCAYTLPIVLPFGRPEIRSRPASSSLRSRCQRGNTARPSVCLSVCLCIALPCCRFATHSANPTNRTHRICLLHLLTRQRTFSWNLFFNLIPLVYLF